MVSPPPGGRLQAFAQGLLRLPRGEGWGPLAHPVIVTSNIFIDDPIPLIGQDAGHQIIEEGTVMADDQNGSGVVNQEFLEEIEGVRIKIVGRFIQHQKIGGLGKKTGQQQAVSFPPESDLTGCLALSGVNKKSWR